MSSVQLHDNSSEQRATFVQNFEQNVSTLVQFLESNRDRIFPPPINTPKEMYEELIYKDRPNPRNKPTNMKGLLTFFVTRGAKEIDITNKQVISRAVSILYERANDHERREYKKLSDEVNNIIKSK